MGATRRKRQLRPRSAAVPRLRALSLAAPAALENSAPGVLVGELLGTTAGGTLALIDDAGGRFALSGSAILAGAVALDRETAAAHAIIVRETLAGYANSPRDSEIIVSVLNAFEAPDLTPLSLSGTEFAVAQPDAGAILGATAGSVIAAEGLPTGLTIDGTARTWTWDGTGPLSSGSLTLTETHADASNSPQGTVIGWTIVEAPTVAISTEFPVLKAAYEAGERALISWIGDSTVANANGGPGLALEQTSTVYYLREYLGAAGLQGVIGGCFSAAEKGLFAAGLNTPQLYGTFYNPDATYDPSFAWYALENSAFGTQHPTSNTVGDKVRYDPGMDYDRVELFYPTFPGGGGFDLKIGEVVVASIDNNQSVAFRKTAAYAVTRTDVPIDQFVTGGYAWPGTVRVWDSTANRKLQVENLGVCGYRTADWLDASNSRKAGATLPILGSHLVIVQLGANDMNTGVSAAAYQANLEALIALIQSAGADVLVCVPTPSTGGHNLSLAHRDAVTAACTASGIGAPVDLYAGIGFDTGTHLADTVHPNAQGNNRIVFDAAGVGQRLLA